MDCEKRTTKDYVRNYNLFMQNEPNLCLFWAVSGDCEEKRTQNEPNSNPIYEMPKMNVNKILTKSCEIYAFTDAEKQTQNKPNQTQYKPN